MYLPHSSVLLKKHIASLVLLISHFKQHYLQIAKTIDKIFSSGIVVTSRTANEF